MSRKVHKVVILTRQDGEPATEFKRQFLCYVSRKKCVWYTFGIGYTREVLFNKKASERLTVLKHVYGYKNVRIVRQF